MEDLIHYLSPKLICNIKRLAKRKQGYRLGCVTALLVKKAENDPSMIYDLAEFTCQIALATLAHRARAVPPEKGLEFFATEQWARHAEWASRELVGHAGAANAGAGQ